MVSNSARTFIDEKFHDTGDLFGLRYNGGLVFLEVLSWSEIKFSPYNLIEEIPPGSRSEYDRLDDEDGDDILYNERREKLVTHASIGQSPSPLRRYTNYPEGENRLRRIKNIGTPTAGDDFGYVDGEQSPFEAPTDVEELYIPPGQHLDFAFYNPTNRSVDPVLNIKMRQYTVRPLDPNNSSDVDGIRRIVATGSPMPIANVGDMNRQARYQLEEHWGVEPITYDRARNL